MNNMGLTKVSGTSISQWETSFFGGYEKILMDHPPVKVPDSLITVPPRFPIQYLRKNLQQKLTDIFLLKVSASKNLMDEILVCWMDHLEQDPTRIEIKDRMIKIPPYLINQVLNLLISTETELGPLFKHYRSLITGTEFMYRLDEKKQIPEKRGMSAAAQKKLGIKYLNLLGDLKNCINNIQEFKLPLLDFKGTTVTNEKLKKSAVFVPMKKSKRPITYSPEEIKMANRLLNQLNISFDPVKDRLNNLKMGKLDVSKIAEIPSGNTQVYYTIEENQSTKPFSVCMLADESGSMSGDKLEKQHLVLRVLFKTFSQILPENKIYVYGHSGVSNPEIRIYNDLFYPGFEYRITNQLGNEHSENYDGPAIEKIYERVRIQTDDDIIFISLSDGSPSGRNYGGQAAINDLKRIIEKCKRERFVTVGIGIDCDLVSQIYTYHVVLEENCPEQLMIRNISSLINRVVKTEFQ